MNSHSTEISLSMRVHQGVVILNDPAYSDVMAARNIVP